MMRAARSAAMITRAAVSLTLLLPFAGGAAQKPKPPPPLALVGERNIDIPGDAAGVYALGGGWAVLTLAPPALHLISPTGETLRTVALDAVDSREAVSDGANLYVRQSDSVLRISATGDKSTLDGGKVTALVIGPEGRPWALHADGAAPLSAPAHLPAQRWVGEGNDLWLVSDKGWTRAQDGKTLSPPPPGELKAALGDLLLVAKDGKFRPFSVQKNDFIWSRKLPSPIRQAFELGGAIYMASEDGLLHRFTKITGFENAIFDLEQRGALLRADWAGCRLISPAEGRAVVVLKPDARPARLTIMPLQLRVMGMASLGDRLALLVQGRDDKYTLNLYHK